MTGSMSPFQEDVSCGFPMTNRLYETVRLTTLLQLSSAARLQLGRSMPRPASSCKGIGLDEADYCDSCKQPALKRKCVRSAAAASTSGSSAAAEGGEQNVGPSRSRSSPEAYQPAAFWSLPLPAEAKRKQTQKQRSADRVREAASAQQKACPSLIHTTGFYPQI